jgi:hypothetical protein
VERWQVERVQTGLKVYVHGLEDAMALPRQRGEYEPGVAVTLGLQVKTGASHRREAPVSFI